ncbi:MAG: 2-oxo acid dehydrogenase subunit E2 [Acidobacteria bacterium]|nr:2-oxo acid dehydrogenase subunit E2 [Acidobacteriota bacterium]
MPTNVVMPQMGESVAEGTLVRWIKKVGDAVDRDEPLFEISTDKVDAEIPSPAAGTLTEIRVKEGETVPVDSVVAVIRQAGEAAPPLASAAPRQEAAGPAEAEAAAPAPPPSPESGRDDLRRQKSSPLVRRIASEHDIDISRLQGSGIGGRVTKKDILKHLEDRATAPAAQVGGDALHAPPAFRPGERVEIVPMSVMRRKIAEHMIVSKRTSAHVHSVFEIDFARVAKIREQKKAEYERVGAKLTFMSFIAKAVCDGLRHVPVINASVDGDHIVYKQDINLGIAVALDWGLIVPVIRNADEKNLLGLSRAILDVATRARAKQLKPEEVQGGTFTITNPGVFGTLFGMPIISQPQVAILGVGAIEKRVVVTDDDAIVVRPRAYMSIGYDHRLVDGAVADEFMSRVKKTIEEFDPAAA